MERLARRIVNHWHKKGYIAQDEIEWCLYGLLNRLTTASTAIVIFAVGCLVSSWSNTLLFLFCVIFLRKYSNGYHASSFGKCFCITLTVSTLSLIAAPYVNKVLVAILLIISSIVIVKYAPVNSDALHLNGEEMRAMRRETRINLLILCMAEVAFLAIDSAKANCIVLAIAVVAMLIIAAKVSEKLPKERIPQDEK